jgi:beta-ureidopropionase / N-carbamoyl-L-amino-acid hydrolase
VFGGGRLDGALGVCAALEVARTLREHGQPLTRAVWVCDYLAEEANDFAVSCVGSRALAGIFKPEFLRAEAAGQTLAEALTAVGGDPTSIMDVSLATGHRPHACLELHIEQGLRLLDAGAALAAVTGIVGIRRGVFEVRGRADHAGSTPMHVRQDALAAAAIAIAHLRALCEDEPRAVGTVGRLEVFPNFSNVIPERVRMTGEVRSLELAVTDAIWQEWCAGMQSGDAKFLTHTVLESQTDAAAAKPPPALFDAIFAACRGLDPQAQQLSSGAGHDTQHLARVAPSGMIFVPSIGGRSHCPEEDTAPEHLALGCQALLDAVRRVDALRL